VSHVHHSAIVVRDVDASLQFWRDGIGLDVLMDHEFEGSWRDLFGARSDRLRSVFLGDPARPDAGIVELVLFDDASGALASDSRPVGSGSGAGGAESSREVTDAPAEGFFLLSLFVDVDAVLARLARLGLGGRPRRISVPSPNGGVSMAAVRDPDGVLVELIGAPSP
jgi:catechol 2,3-dioxygenase-like lactoylglutathione lyase family enzyme